MTEPPTKRQRQEKDVSIKIVRALVNFISLSRIEGLCPIQLVTTSQNIYSVDVMRLLVEDNIDVNIKDPDGYTLLMRAILKSPYSKDLVPILIDNGAGIEELDSYERTPLMLTCYPGISFRYEQAHILILAGADVNKLDRSGSSAISLAAKNGHLNICQLLIAHGADINQSDKLKCTPLFWAAQHGHKKVCQLLLNHGADATKSDIIGHTPLSIASTMEHQEIKDLLDQYEQNQLFTWTESKPLQTNLWSTKNINTAFNFILCHKKDKDEESIGKIPIDIIRDIILPLAIDRKDSVE